MRQSDIATESGFPWTFCLAEISATFLRQTGLDQQTHLSCRKDVANQITLKILNEAPAFVAWSRCRIQMKGKSLCT